VIDADALNVLRGKAALLRKREAPTILTPHPGELSRLIDSSMEEIQADRLLAARSAADLFEAVVVLKGAATVTAEPNGEAWINPFSNNGMASGGMGDVLTGVIAALMAANDDPMTSAVAGVYLHGLAGDIAGREMGPRGFLATDVAERLPQAYKALWD